MFILNSNTKNSKLIFKVVDWVSLICYMSTYRKEKYDYEYSEKGVRRKRAKI